MTRIGRPEIGTEFLDTLYVNVSGDTMTGLLQFSGTDHAGLQFISLTTAQRDALTPSVGMVIYNTTDGQFQGYDGSWGQIVVGGATTALDNLSSVAINTSLISDADSTDDLGSSSIAWANLYVDTIRSITGNPLTLTPIAGQNLNINLSTTGDFAVNTNQLYVDTSSGFVGIGTTQPSENLVVIDSSFPYIVVQETLTGVTNGTGVIMVRGDQANGYSELLYYTGTTADWSISVEAGNRDLAFIEKDPSVRNVVFTRGGKVGIGTTNPTGTLDVKGDLYIRDVSPEIRLIDTNAGKKDLALIVNNDLAHFYETGSSIGTLLNFDLINNRVGIGTSSPTNILSFNGESAQTLWMERTATAATAGYGFTFQAGGAVVGGTNLAGGTLLLKSGTSTGSGEAGVTIQGCVAGVSGTTDGTFQDMVKVLGNKLGFFNVTPIVQPSTTGTTAGFTVGTGTGVNDDSTFTGNTGSNAYTIGDIVLALKQVGILVA